MFELESYCLANGFAWAEVVLKKKRLWEIQRDGWKNKAASYKILVSETVLAARQPHAYGKRSLGDRHQQAGVRSFV